MLENSGIKGALKSRDDRFRRDARDAPSDRDRFFQICFNKARKYWIEGKKEQSVAPYDEFLSAYPGDAQGIYWRGKTYLKLGKLDQALVDLDKAVETNPRYDFLITRAEVYARKAHQDCIEAEQKKGKQINAPQSAKEDSTANGSVLLVEGQYAGSDFAARALISRGYEVLKASTGLDAIRLLENHDGKVDLVISDVYLPDIDGPTLLRSLRKRNCHAKLIFIISDLKDASVKNFDDDVQFAYLPKPFRFNRHNLIWNPLEWLVECGER